DAQTPGHHAIVFGVVMATAGQELETATLALGASFVSGLATAAVRLGGIGQVAAPRGGGGAPQSIRELASWGPGMPLDDLGSYMPLIDVAGLRQPGLVGRVFAS